MKTKPAYVIIEVDIKDAAAFQRYVEGHQLTLEPYGGRFLAASSQVEAIEGKWQPKRIIIQQWPSVKAFKAWYNSTEYQRWKALRQQAAETQAILVEGLGKF